jgi:HEAT repeat protein
VAVRRIDDFQKFVLLIQTLGEEDPDVRREEEWVLRQARRRNRDNQSSAELIAATGYAYKPPRLKAAVAQGEISDPQGEIGDPQTVVPLIQALGSVHWLVREKAAVDLAKLPQVTVPDAKATARHLWWQLTSSDHDVANAAMELLGRVVNQMTEAEVAALGDNSPPKPCGFKLTRPLLIILNVVAAGLSGFAFNMLTAALGVPTKPAIWTLVSALTLVILSVIALRLDRQKS